MWYSYKVYLGERYMFKGAINAESEENAQDQLVRMHGSEFRYELKMVK